MKKLWIVALGAVALIMLGTVIYIFQPSDSHTEEVALAEESSKEESDRFHFSSEQIENAGIEVKVAEPGKVRVFLTLPGWIVFNPDRFAHVVTKTSGVVRKANKSIGDTVSEGEVLAIIDSKEVAEIKSAYIMAKQRLALANTLFSNEKSLKEKRISSEQDFLHSQTSASEAQTELELAKHKIHSLGINEESIDAFRQGGLADFRSFEIRAPFDGTIIHRHLTLGEAVDDTQNAYVIADLSKVWVEMGISPKDILLVSPGQQVEVTNECGEKATATISRLSPLIDRENARAKAIAELRNEDGRWRPGGYVIAKLAIKEIEAPVVVPVEAVVRIDNEDFIFVSYSDGFEKRPVIKGETDGEVVAISSGLHPGEPYVAKNAFVLKIELMKGEP